MDLSKAFDAIPHGLLLAKLKAYGYNDDVLMLIRSYISNRKQRVKVNEARSEWSVINLGVPQGSILGPTLFNVFLNDLFLCMEETTIYNYADDNTISGTSHSLDGLVSMIETKGTDVTEWFTCNGMKANPDKYQAIIFGSLTQAPSSLTIMGIHVPCQDSVNLLGITIDSDLNFNSQANLMCKKASKQVNAMMRLHRVLDVEAKKAIYHSFIYSNFTYCPVLWLMCSKTSFLKIEAIHRRALKFLYNDFHSS